MKSMSLFTGQDPITNKFQPSLDAILDHAQSIMQYSWRTTSTLSVSMFTHMACAYHSATIGATGVLEISNVYQTHIFDFLGSKVEDKRLKLEYDSTAHQVIIRFLKNLPCKTELKNPNSKFQYQDTIIVPPPVKEYIIPVTKGPVKSLKISHALDMALTAINPLVMGECGTVFTLEHAVTQVGMAAIAQFKHDGKSGLGEPHGCLEMITYAALLEGIRYCDISRVASDDITAYCVL